MTRIITQPRGVATGYTWRMGRAIAVVILALSLAPIGRAGQTPREQSKQVVIDVVAVDKKGAPVMDMRPDDFQVQIGHFRVPIASVTAVTPSSEERAGRFVVLVLDDIAAPAANIPRVRELAGRFIDKMTPGDRMAVVMLDGAGAVEATDEPGVLRQAIGRYSPHGGFTTRDGLGQQVLDTMSQIARQVMEVPGRRKTIVGIGTGWVFDRPIPNPIVGGRDLRPEWTDAMRAMAYAKTNLYVIDPGGVGTTGAYNGDTGLARETGGHAFINTNDFDGAVDRILAEASNYYVISVPDPPTGHGADLRELEVTTGRRGVTVRARHAIPGS